MEIWPGDAAEVLAFHAFVQLDGFDFAAAVAAIDDDALILARDTAQHGRLARTDDLAPEGDAVDHAAVRSDDASGGLEGRREREVLHREIFDRPLVAAEQSEGLARRGRLHVSDRVALAVEHAAEIDQTSGLERDGTAL